MVAYYSPCQLIMQEGAEEGGGRRKREGRGRRGGILQSDKACLNKEAVVAYNYPCQYLIM